ncbi:uncharacterized protein LOC123471456 [Daphnia magna]|uniref:uncharacterized protein LOC123471456 n=1 Tax=Daphnia magna TaxID=35525 RepID=UPI001E1BD03F|nr:uncharacterized protein LOC123471456 [Daphnia magna]
MARYLYSMFVFLLCASKMSSTNGFSWNKQLQQATGNHNKILQLENRDTRLEALEFMVQQHDEIREALTSKVFELEAKVQQQQLLLDALQNAKPRSHCQSVVNGDNDNKSRAVSAMPASCADLQVMGYDLNGFYSVMGVGKMNSVYCDFTKPSSESGFQQLIGFTEIKSVSTAFYVQRSSSFTQINTPIPFQVERLNVGGAMNLTSGIFTAPVTGSYFFCLSGTAYISESTSRLVFTISLYMNDNPIAYGYADEMSTEYQYETFSLQSTLHLMKGDQVWLQISSIGTGVYLYGGLFTHFNGWLLQEDIFQSTNIK